MIQISLIKAGVLQGDTLPPLIFIIILDYILRTSVDKHSHLGFPLSERLSSRYPAKKLTDVDYADDLVLTSDIVPKCVIPSTSSRKCCPKIKTLSAVEIKAVESFTYLGSQINSTVIFYCKILTL